MFRGHCSENNKILLRPYVLLNSQLPRYSGTVPIAVICIQRHIGSNFVIIAKDAQVCIYADWKWRQKDSSRSGATRLALELWLGGGRLQVAMRRDFPENQNMILKKIKYINWVFVLYQRHSANLFQEQLVAGCIICLEKQNVGPCVWWGGDYQVQAHGPHKPCYTFPPGYLELHFYPASKTQLGPTGTHLCDTTPDQIPLC